jgi:exonuclease V gamma subunit
LVWSVLGVADRNAQDPVLAPFLDLAPGASRYANARRVADLFDRYHLHLPDMVRHWDAGDPTHGAGRTLAGRLLLLDALTMEWREVRVVRDPACPVCQTSAH